MPRPMLPELGSPCSKQVFCLIFYRENFPAIMFFFILQFINIYCIFKKQYRKKGGKISDFLPTTILYILSQPFYFVW